MDAETPVQVALQHLEQQRQAQAHQEAERAAAELELASLRQRAGEEVLDDPGSGAGLSRAMQGLRDRIEIATSAAAAAKSRVAAAESAYLAAEADALEVQLAAAKATLDKHKRRTAELLEALEAHEGKFVPETDLINTQRFAGIVGGPTTWSVPRGAALHDAVQTAEKRVWLMRELAAGRDPHRELQAAASTHDGKLHGRSLSELYPESVWGPQAVVPAPAYQRSAGGSRQLAPTHDGV